MYYLIYKITNNVNNKIYIGKHQTENKDDDYMGSGKILKKAIEKYGLDKFTKEILFECDSLEEMNQKEAEIVDEEFIARLDTYNLQLGGNPGWDYIHKTKKHLFGGYTAGKLHKEKMLNDKKYKENFLNKLYIAMNNEEYKEKVSKGLKLYYQTHDNPFIRQKHTIESKAKIGKANSIKQKGQLNSQYGKCWIYNEELKKNKSIKKEDLNQWLEKGWKKGRKMSF